MPYTYQYPHFAVTTDCVVFGLHEETLMVLLIERADDPFKGSWALPGGFLDPKDKTLEEGALRELREETGIESVYLEQLYSFGDIGRDPRERVVTVAHYALVKLSDHRIRAATDARDARWFPIDDLPSLAFDHQRVFELALDRLRGKLRYAPIGFELLPPKFTLTELQRVYEIVLGRPLDKRNFRRKLLAMELVVELDEMQTGVAHRAARLYRFDARRYRKLTKQGFAFEL